MNFTRLSKKSKISVGEELYLMPLPEDGDIPPQRVIVTEWGSKHHDLSDEFLVEVIKVENHCGRIDFLPIELLFRKNEGL